MQEDNIQKAIACIKNEEVVGIPTETVYGIGVDPLSQAAVDKIFNLKERDENKPLSILLHSFQCSINEISQVRSLLCHNSVSCTDIKLSSKDSCGHDTPENIIMRWFHL